MGYTQWTTPTQIYVDESINSLRIVAASKQGDYDDVCSGARDVEIAMPTEYPRPTWIPVSPADPELTPANWDIRNSEFDDVVIIPDPSAGTWQVRSRYRWTICRGVEAPTATAYYDVMINSSAESNIQLTARFLPPIVNNQGTAGDYIPIVATLLYRNGAIPGAIIGGYIEKPGGLVDWFILWDDGLHNDGSASDGVYGNEYRTAFWGGNYNVRMAAFVYDPVAGEWGTREWNGGFYMTGPNTNPELDQDQDNMPDAWELRCNLNTQANDALEDNDQDGLQNIWELIIGTLPCQADTDRGGERDGSECTSYPCPRNPLFAPDDLVRPLGHISVIALNERIRIQWTHPLTYTNMVGWIGIDPDELGRRLDMGNSGIYTDTEVLNDQTYFVRLSGQNGTAEGDYSDPIPVTPRADPDSPSGAILINSGAVQTLYRDVMLNISASDIPLDGMPSPASAVGGGPLAVRYNAVSAAIEMRISNNSSFIGAAWEPMAQEKAWTLADSSPGVRVVYAQFRDGAGNESLVVYDTILYKPFINYIPVITK